MSPFPAWPLFPPLAPAPTPAARVWLCCASAPGRELPDLATRAAPTARTEGPPLQAPGPAPESVSKPKLQAHRAPEAPSPRPRARPAEPKPGRTRPLAAPARRPIVLLGGGGVRARPRPPVGVQFMVLK